MVDANVILEFLKLLNSSDIKYVLIKNDDDAIPYKVESDNDIDF